MITLTAILIVGFFVSSYRINKKCKAKKESFNPLNGSILEWFFFILGFIATLFSVGVLFFKFLP